MARFFRAAILMAFILSARSAFAAGGACPSGANYTNPTNPTGARVTLSSLGIASCYFVAASGSDSNAGTTEAAPWLHAPFMPGCSSNCATFQNSLAGTNAAGYGIILHGGDTFNMGAGNAPWNFNQYPGPYVYGTSANPFYVGVDPGWPASGWARPIITGGNALCGPGNVGAGCTYNSSNICPGPGSPNSCTGFYYVNSCTYQTGASNNLISIIGLQYIIVDNLELTGLCQNQLVQSNGQEVQGNNTYIRYGSNAGPIWLENNYIHGWSHLKFAGPNGNPTYCSPGVVCTDIFAFQGGAGVDNLYFNVVDGADSDAVGAGLVFGGFNNAAYNVFRYTTQGIMGIHLFHDNLYEYFYENGHSNLIESSDPSGTNAIYNNVFRHVEVAGGNGGVGLWFGPAPGATDYIFNNIGYDWGPIEYLNNGGQALTTVYGNYVWFNNTWQTNVNQPILRCNGFTNGTVIDTNNHYIDDGGYILGPCSTLTSTTPLLMTNAVATSNGYTSSQTFAYSPTSGSSPTVGKGTNEQSFCSAISTAAANNPTLSDAVSTCQNDTPYACTYISSNHISSCPARRSVIPRPVNTAWDRGAYQSNGTQANAPNPPSNLAAIVQ
jgi:hypothetical protein